MGMNLRGQVWKRAWKKPAFFEGQDLENRAAHPHQEFPGVPPGSNHCYVKSKRVRPRSAKELITRNESREVGLFNPLSPNIHIQILQTGLYTFP